MVERKQNFQKETPQSADLKQLRGEVFGTIEKATRGVFHKDKKLYPRKISAPKLIIRDQKARDVLRDWGLSGVSVVVVSEGLKNCQGTLETDPYSDSPNALNFHLDQLLWSGDFSLHGDKLKPNDGFPKLLNTLGDKAKGGAVYLGKTPTGEAGFIVVDGDMTYDKQVKILSGNFPIGWKKAFTEEGKFIGADDQERLKETKAPDMQENKITPSVTKRDFSFAPNEQGPDLKYRKRIQVFNAVKSRLKDLRLIAEDEELDSKRIFVPEVTLADNPETKKALSVANLSSSDMQVVFIVGEKDAVGKNTIKISGKEVAPFGIPPKEHSLDLSIGEMVSDYPFDKEIHLDYNQDRQSFRRRHSLHEIILGRVSPREKKFYCYFIAA